MSGPSRIGVASALLCGACSAPSPTCVADGNARVLVSEGGAAPETIVADADGVYWSNSNANLRRRGTDGAVTTVGVGLADAMVVDDQWLYWVTLTGGLRRVLKTGGQEFSMADIACDSGSCDHGMAIDQDAVYWSQQTKLFVAAKAGGSPLLIEDGLAGQQIAVDNDNVYWNQSLVINNAVAYLVEATPKTGGAPRPLAMFDTPWAGPIVVSNKVAIVRQDGVWWIPTDGSEPQLFARGPFSVIEGVVTNGTNIDILEKTRIVSVDADGSERTVACFATQDFRQLATTASDVVWSVEHASEIWDAPR